MHATLIHGDHDIRFEEVPDPVLLTDADAIVRVVAACVCGSDLWPYRGVTQSRGRIGHEFVGIVESVGAAVSRVTPGDFVIAPFYVCDMTCVNCRNGFSTSCLQGSWWGGDDRQGHPADGGQGELIRVPLADGTLHVVPGPVDDALVPHLLTLSDVMGTGHHAAVSAGVREGDTVVVVGDGAVGLCAVLAASRLGASRVVAMSRHASRQALAREFGATGIVEERGEEGIRIIREMFDGVGADRALECVGTEESMAQAFGATRPGGQVGFVGVPNLNPELKLRPLFSSNVGLRGGVAPVRNYVAELLPEVLDGRLRPGAVFDLELPLAEVAEAYRAMDERRAIKVLLRP
jgi:threonine dehydrogenase-like Zn-dependent dehydrogenase